MQFFVRCIGQVVLILVLLSTFVFFFFLDSNIIFPPFAALYRVFPLLKRNASFPLFLFVGFIFISLLL